MQTTPAGAALTAIDGLLTYTVAEAVFTQAPHCILTVYVVVTSGVAIGFLAVVLLKPAAGDQEYDTPPLAINCVDWPRHNVLSDTVIVGGISSRIVMDALDETFPVQGSNTATVTFSATSTIPSAIGLRSIFTTVVPAGKNTVAGIDV